MAMVVSGRGGAIRYGYQVAAVVGDWSVSVTGAGRYTFSADVEVTSPHWASQPALTVAVRFGSQELTWSGVAVAIAGGKAECRMETAPSVEAVAEESSRTQ